MNFLDVEGIEPPEAGGVESVLKGLRKAILNHDLFLASASGVFDGLFSTFSQVKTKS